METIIVMEAWEAIALGVFTLMMGLGIAGVWTADLASGKFSGHGGFFSWHNDAGEPLWTHVLAEYLTATGLIAAAAGAFAQAVWAVPLSLIFLGALAYTSLNSLGWTFARKGRTGYAIPMITGLAGSIFLLCLILW
ncbi:MAG: hypothetical protein ACLFPE_08450 [Bacteroidales bacterium]